MNRCPDWSRLADRGTARGANDVFDRSKALADGGSLPFVHVSGRTRGRRVLVVGIVAGLVVAALGGVFLATRGNSGEAVEVGPATEGVPPTVQGPSVLGLDAPPPGYARTTSANQDASFIWAGRQGRLRVFQRVDGGGGLAGVQAVAVTSPGERTALDFLNTDSSSPQVAERDEVSVEGQVAVHAELIASPSDSFGAFSLLRWTDAAGRTVTIAWRNRTLDEVLPVARSLVADPDGGLSRIRPESGWSELQGVDPVHVPIRADQMNQWTRYEGAGTTFTLGTATEHWPSPINILWWIDGARLLDASTATGSGLAYHVDERGVAIIDTPTSTDESLVEEVLNKLTLMTLSSWSDSEIPPAQPTTTSTAPPTSTP